MSADSNPRARVFPLAVGPDDASLNEAPGWLPQGAALAETLDGGQCFRWNRAADGGWRGVSGACAAEVHETSACAHANIVAGNARDLHWHLATDVDWPALADQMPWRTDAHLACCMAAFPGLRILRQPIGEALLCFLCSATKQIVQIKQMAELLAARFGRVLPAIVPGAAPPATRALAAPGPAREHCHRIVDTADPAGADEKCHPLVGATSKVGPPERCHPLVDTFHVGGEEGPGSVRRGVEREAAEAQAIHALPTWEELARVSETDMRACKLGFRARHVHAVAQRLAEQPGWLEATAALPYVEAKARLLTLPGVGEKIADCVLLFGAAKLEAFPVDVWILRALARRYRLDGWSPAQVAQFGRAHFGPLAGLAQQFLFAWERRHGESGIAHRTPGR